MKNRIYRMVSLSVFCLLATASRLGGQTEYANSDINQEESYVALLQQGLPLYLESRIEFTTKYLKEGDNLIFHVKFPILVENEMVIPKGREAVCRINRLEKPGGGGKPGFMEIQPLYIKLDGNKVVPLNGDPSGHGGRDRQAAAMAYSQATMSAAQSMMELHHYQVNRQMQQQETAMNNEQQSLIMPADAMPPPQHYMAASGNMPPFDPMMYQYQSTYPPSSSAIAIGKQNNGGLLKVAQLVSTIGPLVSLLIKGKHAVLPAGYVMSASIAWGTWVELK